MKKRTRAMNSKSKKAEAALRTFALKFPGAREEFPWGERVVKVGKKVFVFMGAADDGGFGLSVKLPESGPMALLLPFVRNLKILRQWTGRCDISADFSPIMGFTGVDGLVITTGWGTWGFKGIPAGGEQMAELIATNRTPDLIAPFALSRFAADHAMADQGSTGTR